MTWRHYIKNINIPPRSSPGEWFYLKRDALWLCLFLWRHHCNDIIVSLKARSENDLHINWPLLGHHDQGLNLPIIFLIIIQKIRMPNDSFAKRSLTLPIYQTIQEIGRYFGRVFLKYLLLHTNQGKRDWGKVSGKKFFKIFYN